MSFTFGGESSGGLDQLLQKGNDSVRLREVLDHKDLPQEFRRQNQRLMNYLLDPSITKELFQMLINADKREDHKKVIQLFLTSNTQLHRIFATSLELSDAAFETLNTELCQNDQQLSSRAFAAGTLARLLSRALDYWPDAIAEVFRASTSIYPLIIKNLNRRLVFQTIADLMSENHRGLVELLWHVWMVMSGKTAEKKNRPRRVFLLPDLDKEQRDALKASFTIDHMLNAVDLLKMFFGISGFEDMRDFAKLVYDWVVGLQAGEMLPSMYDLVRVIGDTYKIYSAEFIERTISIVIQCNNVCDKAVCSAIEYLASVKQMIDDNCKLEIVRKVFLCELYSQFAIFHATELMNVPKLADPGAFKSIIISCWNKWHDTDTYGNRNFCGSCLEAAKVLKQVNENIWEDNEQMDSAVETWKVISSGDGKITTPIDFSMTLVDSVSSDADVSVPDAGVVVVEDDPNANSDDPEEESSYDQ